MVITVNGDMPRIDQTHDSSSSGEGQDGDEDGNAVQDMLGKISKPEVVFWLPFVLYYMFCVEVF